MYKFFFLTIFSIFLCATNQAQTFKAGAFAGLTASQINGDDSAGFNKPGIEGGLRIGVNLKEKTALSLEIQYSQRGAKEEVSVDGTPQAIYRINYISVPVIFNFKDWISEDYYRLHFHGGLNYGRLVSADLINDSADNSRFVSTWRENDLSFLFGATYFLNKNFGLTVRYTRSLFLLFRTGDTATFTDNSGVEMMQSFNTNSLLPYHLSFLATYMF